MYITSTGEVWSTRIIANFEPNVPLNEFLKIGQYVAKIWTQVGGLLFWPSLYIGKLGVRVYVND